MLVCRTLSGNGAVLASCETVLSRSAFATRCWVTSEAAWDSRAFNGDDQCWLSLRLLCRALQRSLEHGGARLALDVSWFGRAVAVLAFCETVLWRSAFEKRVGLLPRLHWTATLPMVMVSAGFL